MYRELGHDRASAAKLLHVTVRTLQNWESGRNAVPYAAYKLLRLMCRHELPGKAWEGWTFSQGVLWSPGGDGFRPHEFSWLSLLIRQARMFTHVYRERSQVLRELAAARQALSMPPRTASAFFDDLVELGMDGGLPAAPRKPTQAAQGGGRTRGSAVGTGPADGLVGKVLGSEVLVTPHKRLSADTRSPVTTGLPVYDWPRFPAFGSLGPQLRQGVAR